MTDEPTPSRQARRVLRWYPRSFRDRYGEEFLDLLESEISEYGRSWRLLADLARGAARARLDLVLVDDLRRPAPERVRGGLNLFGCAFSAFLLVACTVWSQLSVGWRWAEPSDAMTAAMLLMTAAMAVLVGVLVAVAVPLAACTIRELVRGRWRELGLPVGVLLAGASVLVVGARHFANGWPGTGGHLWPGQWLVPPGMAAFAWASTLSLTSYWAHPADLMAFPVAELWWMALSPIALAATLTGAALTVRRLELSRRHLGFGTRLAPVACFGMLVFALGAWLWILGGSPGPAGLFRAGAIDVAGGVAMTAALVAAGRAARRVRAGGRSFPVY